jgi:hypothetical protein
MTDQPSGIPELPVISQITPPLAGCLPFTRLNIEGCSEIKELPIDTVLLNLHDELRKKFDGKFPDDPINEVASDMEVDGGLRGVEDSGNADDATETEGSTIAR